MSGRRLIAWLSVLAFVAMLVYGIGFRRVTVLSVDGERTAALASDDAIRAAVVKSIVWDDDAGAIVETAVSGTECFT